VVICGLDFVNVGVAIATHVDIMLLLLHNWDL
jgi:hypothetical protein